MLLAEQQHAVALLGGNLYYPQQRNRDLPKVLDPIIEELIKLIKEIKKEGNERVKALTR